MLHFTPNHHGPTIYPNRLRTLTVVLYPAFNVIANGLFDFFYAHRVCQEHCPTGEKAIVFDQREVLVGSEVRTLKLPRVVHERCIGCGICETRCPLDGRSAIRVVNESESRKPRDLWS